MADGHDHGRKHDRDHDDDDVTRDGGADRPTHGRAGHRLGYSVPEYDDGANDDAANDDGAHDDG